MSSNDLSVIFQDAIGVALRLGGPILILCMAVGVVVAILQAVTQIHEQSIAFVLKLIVVILFLMIGGNWMLRQLQEYALRLFDMMV